MRTRERILVVAGSLALSALHLPDAWRTARASSGPRREGLVDPSRAEIAVALASAEVALRAGATPPPAAAAAGDRR